MGIIVKARRGEALELNWTWAGWLLDVVQAAGGSVDALHPQASGSDYLRAQDARRWSEALERAADDLYELWIPAPGYVNLDDRRKNNMRPVVARRHEVRVLLQRHSHRVRPVRDNDLLMTFVAMCRDGGGVWFRQ